MANPFEVAVDNSGRIKNFIPEGYPGVGIDPASMSEVINGGERVTLRGVEYDLTENGSLVHPDVEVINSVILGNGVRIDDGTVFHRYKDGLNDPKDKITIGDRARIKGTEIHDQVEVGRHALVLARSIGMHSKIGQYARVGINATVGAAVSIGNTAKIDRDSQIGHHAQIERAVRIGYKSTIGEGAQIGHHARIGAFTGEGPRGVNQDGVLIRPGDIVPPKAQVAG